jgi:putative membrane protein
MQPGAKKFIQRWLITTLAVLVAVFVLPGLHFTDHSLWTPFVTSLILGILNAFIRPIMLFMALPLLIFTLGLFTLVINALLLYFVAWLLPTFQVDGFGWAFLGSLIISVVSVALNILTGSSRARVSYRHRRGPPPSDRGGSGGGGPVIDV